MYATCPATGTPSWTISRTCCCSSISTGRAASRTGIRSAASTPSSNMRRLSRYRPPSARSSRPPAASADSIRQAVLLATPSSRATWVAPSSRWAAKQSSTEAAIETDRRDEAEGTEGSRGTGGAEVVDATGGAGPAEDAGAAVSAGTPSVPGRHLVGRRHVHLGNPVAVGHQRGSAAAPDPHHDLLGVVRLARIVTMRPGGEGPDRTGMGGRDDPGVRRLGHQPVEPAPEPAHAGLRRLEVHQRDGQPHVDRVRPAELVAVEPVDLHQPARPVADRHPLQLLHQRLVLAERRGDVARPVRRPDLEVAQLGDRLRLADVRFPPPLRQAVGHAAVDLVRGLPGPAGVGADDPHLLAGPDALGQAVPALVRLPAAHRGQAGVGGVALGDPVPDDPDLGGEVLPRLALRRRDDLLVPGGAGELAGEALAVHLEQGTGGTGALPTPGPTPGALPEPAQVQREVRVRLAGARGLSRLLEPTPFGITG